MARNEIVGHFIPNDARATQAGTQHCESIVSNYCDEPRAVAQVRAIACAGSPAKLCLRRACVENKAPSRQYNLAAGCLAADGGCFFRICSDIAAKRG